MNKDTLSGQWKQLKGKVKEQWGRLTDEDLTAIEGRRDQLLGKIQERYGLDKDLVEKQVAEFEKKYESIDQPAHSGQTRR